MSENTRPRPGGGAADDVLGALSARARELQSKVAGLQADLDEAQRRVATYEEFDDTLRDALSNALRAAHDIRTRAQQAADQILEQAREERRILLKEVQRLREERDSLQEELAQLRRSGITPVARPAPQPETSAADLRAAATDALRVLLEDVLRDVRAPRTAEPPRSAPVFEPPIVEPPKIEPPPPVIERPAAWIPPSPEAPAAPRIETVAPPEERPAARVAEPPARRVEERAAPRIEVGTPRIDMPPSRPAKPPLVTGTLSAPPAAITPAPPRAAPPAAPRPEPAAPRVETVGPRIEAPRRDIGERIAPTAPEGAAAEAGAPTTELQLVLKPVPSFPRLVEIERRIQALPGVRTLYVRDFRNGIATLAVGLRTAMTADEFASTVRTLDAPKFALEGVERNTVELRIEGEAATA